jgi:hypothetical protein
MMNETKKDGMEMSMNMDDKDMVMMEDDGLEDLALSDEADGMNPNKALALSMTEGSELTEKKKKNVPTNPSLWKKSLDWARARYKVCPSAYCNGAAAKHYKSKGGKWKRK